jgi:hypothetical protein
LQTKQQIETKGKDLTDLLLTSLLLRGKCPPPRYFSPWQGEGEGEGRGKGLNVFAVNHFLSPGPSEQNIPLIEILHLADFSGNTVLGGVGGEGGWSRTLKKLIKELS